MSVSLTSLSEKMLRELPLLGSSIDFAELTLTADAAALLTVCEALKTRFQFEQLVDLAAVDYLQFGDSEWKTDDSSHDGFSRGVQPMAAGRFQFDDAPGRPVMQGPRFAVVYHLLSIKRNTRVRLKVYCIDNDYPMLESVNSIWNSANWYEREAFDLFGILFHGHPDLRRILTDYGFVGHPFRKDFPLIGNVEMRYDEEQQRVIYEPVSIEPRVLVPRVIRESDQGGGL